MKALTILKGPYNDQKLNYNENTGRYELTIQYLKDEFGPCYADDGIATQRIKLNSRVVYSYILIHTATFNRQVVNFLLTKTEEGRKFLLDILREQQYADIQTGYNDLKYTPAISFGNGQDKDRNEIRKNGLCIAAEEIFQSSAEYFGFNIGYLGQFPPFIYQFVRDY